MKEGIVRRIKAFHHIKVANAMGAMGYCWQNPKHRPTNIERMVQGLPRVKLEELLATLNGEVLHLELIKESQS